MLINSLTSIFIRGVSILSKYFLIYFMIDKVNLGTYGEFAIFSSVINFTIYFLGLDYYTYYTRHLINQDKKNDYLSEIFSFNLTLFIILMPFFIILQFYGFLKFKHITLFIFILFFDYFSQEFFRTLIAIKKNIHSNWVVFIKNFLFATISITYIFHHKESPNVLFIIYIIWLFSSLIASLFGYYWLVKSLGSILIVPFNFKFKNIKGGLKVSARFFAGTILFNAIYTLDKIFIFQMSNNTMVGIYSFFLSLCLMLTTLIEVGVVNQYLPDLLESRDKTPMSVFFTQKKTFRVIILSISLTCSIIFCLTIKPLLTILNKNELLSHIDIFYVLIVAVTIFCISLIPHYILYVHNKDAEILRCTVISFVGFLLWNIIFTKLGVIGVSYGLTFAFLLLLISKSYYFFQISD